MRAEAFSRNRTALIIALWSSSARSFSVSAPRERAGMSRKNKTGRRKYKALRHEFTITRVHSNSLMQDRILDVGGRRVELSLRNGYEKNITAWAVSVNGLLNTMDFVYSEGEDRIGIIPEAVYTTTFGYAQNHHAVAARQDLDIKVLAVVFDDKSGDGDQQLVAGLLDWRRKSKERLTRIVALLDRDLNSLGAIDDTAFNGVKSRLSSLAVSSHGPNERDDVLRWLGEHARDLSPRERIERVKETCESLLARL